VSPAGFVEQQRFKSTLQKTQPPLVQSSEPALSTDAPHPLRTATPARLRLTGWKLDLANFAALMAVAGLLLLRSSGRSPDDGFIFFRYARNLVESHVWSYNPGLDTLNGATSPLWTAILGLAYWLTDGHIVGAADVLYAACLAGAGAVAIRMFRELGSQIAGYATAALLVSNPVFLWVRGMETALMVLLCMLSLYAATKRDAPWWEGVAAGLLVLCRPEGAILIALTYSYRWASSRRFPTVSVLGAIATVTPWLVVSTIALGSPLSETLAAKTAQGRSGFFGPDFVFVRYLGTMVRQPWSVLLMCLAALGFAFAIRRRALLPAVALITGFSSLHFLLYGLAIRPPAYLWYYAVTYLGLSVLSGVGVQAIYATTQRRARSPRSRLPATTWLGAAVCLAVATALVGAQVAGQRRGDIYQGYREASTWLVDNAAPQATVSATEIGVLGWDTDLPVVDYLGLLDDQVVPELARGDLGSWIEREQPDFYLVHLPIWPMEAPSAGVPWFSSAYKPVMETGRIGAWSNVRVYERVRTAADARQGPAGTPLVTDHLTEALADQGVILGPKEKLALQRALTVYVADVDLQEQVETRRGMDFTVMLSELRSSKVPEMTEVELAALAAQLDGIVLPLAPRVG
jgi:hypothetical protein